ncbi:hypothetical protein DEFDS_P020 (plasmid) [Deferribacter desulfuricans SSM1]|uniref:Uncharacterized protein n=1 Tax=Deferribacter desulfuricans (strain DSM 14783 / JCM 11476 / NBRC 101012 / SSM1) TaxID=639282 RepID=D3PEK6_DEFDS|nr:hypothetical protein [Deferribacter desulfuricans]BAI81648.1 hypothetical protein DEFDS_P020 [Deferribacter desulfuricans SSM1]
MPKFNFKLPKFKIPKLAFKVPKFSFKIPKMNIKAPKMKVSSSKGLGNKRVFILLGVFVIVLVGVKLYKNNPNMINNISNFTNNYTAPSQVKPTQKPQLVVQQKKLAQDTKQNLLNTSLIKKKQTKLPFTRTNTTNEKYDYSIRNKSNDEIDEIVRNILYAKQKELNTKKDLIELTSTKYQILKAILNATPKYIKQDKTLQKSLVLAIIEKELGLEVDKELLKSEYSNQSNNTTSQSTTVVSEPAPSLPEGMQNTTTLATTSSPIETVNNDKLLHSNNSDSVIIDPEKQPSIDDIPYIVRVKNDLTINDIYAIGSTWYTELSYRNIPLKATVGTYIDPSKRIYISKITSRGIILKDKKHKNRQLFISYNTGTESVGLQTVDLYTKAK